MTHRSRERRRQLAHLWQLVHREIRAAWATRPAVGELWHLYRPQRTITPAVLVRDLQQRNAKLAQELADQVDRRCEVELQLARATERALVLDAQIERAFRVGHAVGHETGHVQGEAEGLSFDTALRSLQGPEGYAQ